MSLRVSFLASAVLALSAGAASAQAVSEWRTVAPENLLVIDTVHGRVLAELSPALAPGHVERIRALADAHFYDGLKFHRVIRGFMAQTGDPQGTGQGGSDLPDVAGEFSFRRAPGGFASVGAGPTGGQMGLFGSMAILTQPDAQAMVTADFRVPGHGLFCPGTLGMARAASPDSANSQFFIMTGRKDDLNGDYTAFGRVVLGMDAVRALKVGRPELDGQVEGDPDVMTRVRMASSLPDAERPSVRVMDVRSPAFVALVERTRAARGGDFNVCDIELPAQGG